MARLPVDFTDSSGNLADQLVPQAEQNINANFTELFSGTSLASGTGTFAQVNAAAILVDVGGSIQLGVFGTLGTSTTNIGKLEIKDQYGTVRYIPCLLP